MWRRIYFKSAIIIVIFCGFSLTIFSAEKNGPFTVGAITAEAGEIKSGYLHVPTKSDPGCKIPVTIINGAKKGKVLALMAGVHGYEYPPILALYRLKQKIDPTSLSGTLILTYVANPPASAVSEPIWIDKYEVVYSDMDGLFYPLTEMDYYVEEREKIGYVMDYLGETRKIFRAPFTGILLYLIQTPPTSKGEPLFEVGQIKK